MLYRYLAEHPEVSALSGTPRPAGEGQHVQTVYPADTWHSKAGRFAFRPEARFTEASPLSQSSSETHSTQAPTPLQTLPPLCVHCVPASRATTAHSLSSQTGSRHSVEGH